MIYHNRLRQKCRKAIILIFILIALICIPSAFNPFLHKGKDQISSEDYPNLKISGQEINVTTPENKTYTKPMSGYYPATYGFEDTADGQPAKGWNDNSASGAHAYIISGIGEHNKVLEIGNAPAETLAQITNSFSPVLTGTIEWWWRKSSTQSSCAALNIDGDGKICLAMRMDWLNNGKIEFQSGSWLDTGYTYADDTWIHMRWDFDAAYDNYTLWIDDVAYVINEPFRDGPITNGIDYISFHSFTTGHPTLFYVDAVGYSWDANYDIGDNLNEGLLLSYQNSTSLEWQGYSLDGAINKSILGNTTIPLPSVGVHNIQVFGNNSIGEMFESDIRYFTIKSINIITPENKTYTKPMNGYYPATYGFENDVIGSDPDGWSVSEPGLQSVQVISNVDGHNNVLELFDTESGAGDIAIVNNSFSPQTSGTIEFWYRTSGFLEDQSFRTEYNLDISIYFSVSSGNFQYYNASGWHVLAPHNNDQWYHIRFDFDCASDTYDFYLDGNLIQSNLEFYTAVSSIDKILFLTRQWGTSSDYYSYVDALGYSWDSNYNIGDNLNEGLLLSYENSTILDWQGYSLNGQANKTILGNVTLPFPSNGYHSIQVFGNNSIGEMFDSDKIYFSIEHISIDIITPENKIYTDPMNGYYHATYGFENDVIGENPQSWVCDETYGTIQVISELDNHKNVVEINDDGALGWPGITQYSNFPRRYGTIEFWVRFNSTTEWMQFASRDTADNLVPLRVSIEGGKWKYRNNAGTLIVVPNVADPIVNKWTHIKIDFRCHNAPSYLGLSDDRFVITVDGINSGELEHWFGGKLDYNWFGITGAPDETMTIWVDAIGFSWDPNYNIGDNLNEGLLLTFTNSSTLEWIGYSLDGQANKTIAGNMVIPMPGNGLHSIQVHGRSTYGHYYASNLVYFTVDISMPPPPPPSGDDFMLIFILIGVFSIVGVTIAIVVYKKAHTPSIKPKTLKEPKPRKPKVKKAKPKKRGIIEEEIFCPFCNTTITPQHKFCTYCGSKLGEEGES